MNDPIANFSKYAMIKITKNIIQKNLFFFVVIFLEFFQIFTNIINLFTNISSFSKPNYASYATETKAHTNNESLFISDYLQYLSFSAQARKLIQCEKYEKTNTLSLKITEFEVCSYGDSVFLALICFFTFYSLLAFISIYTLYRHEDSKNKIINSFENNKSTISDCWAFYERILWNFLEILFHLLGSIVIDILINSVFANFYKAIILREFSSIVIIYWILAVLFVILFLFAYKFYITSINFNIHFSDKIKCPYDSLFSVKYDFKILLLKLILAIANNLIGLSIKNIYLLGFLRINIFLGCFFFLAGNCLQLYNKQVIYLINERLNLFRLINNLILNFLFFSQIIFSVDFKINLFSIANLILNFFLSLYFCFLIKNLNYINLVNTDQLILQFAFLLDKCIFKSNKENVKKHVFNFFIFHGKSCESSSCRINSLKEKNNPHKALLAYLNEIKSNDFHKNSEQLSELKFCCLTIASELVSEDALNYNKKLLKLFFLNKNFNLKQRKSRIFVMISLMMNSLKNKINNSSHSQNISFSHNQNSNTDVLESTVNNNLTDKNLTTNNNQSKVNSKSFINFELMNIYTNIFYDLNDSCNIIYDTINSINAMQFDVLFEDSTLLDKKQKVILEKFQLINKFRSEYQNIYSYHFIKIIFKNLFNNKMNIENEVNLPPEIDSLVKEHYLNDKFLNLLFKEHSLKIIQASKDYNENIGKEFTSVLVAPTRKISERKFIELIEKSNGNGFNTCDVFEIINKNKQKNNKNKNSDENMENSNIIKLVMLEVKIFPSISLSELLLTLKCNFLNEDVIIFEEDLRYHSKYLKLGSEPILQKLCLKNSILNSIKNTNIYFSDLFSVVQEKRKKAEHSNIDENMKITENKILPANETINKDCELLVYNDAEKQIKNELNKKKTLKLTTKETEDSLFNVKNGLSYILNYDKYEKSFLNFLSYLREKDNFKDIEITDLEANFKLIRHKQTCYKIETLKVLKDEFYSYYFLKLTRKKLKINEQRNNTLLAQDTYKSLSKNNLTNQLKGKIEELKISDYSQSMQSNRSTQSTSNLNKTNLTPSGIQLNIKSEKNNKKIKSFIRLLLGIILFLFFCGVFVIIYALKSLDEIKMLFELNNNFNKLSTSFAGSMMNAMQNIVIYPSGSTDISGYTTNNTYFDKFIKVGVDMVIPRYMNYELLDKANDMQNTILEVKKVFYAVNDQTIKEEFLYKKFKNYFVTNANNEITVQAKDSGFFESLDIFLSSAMNIGNNLDLLTPIYIIDSSSGQYDFKNFYAKNLTSYQISAINILINYEIITVNADISKEFLSGLFYQRVDHLYILLFGANLFLTGFHILLIFLIIITINYFKKTLHLNICVMSHLIKDEKVNFIRNKVRILKQLSLLYNENPEDLIKSLKILKKNYREKIQQVKNKSVEEKKNKINFNKTKQLKDLADDISLGNISSTSTNKQIAISINIEQKEQSSNFPILKTNNLTIGKLNENNLAIGDSEKDVFKNQKQSFFILSNCKLFSTYKNMLILFFIFFFGYFIIFFYTFLQIHNSNIQDNKFSQLNFDNHQKIIKHGVLMSVSLMLNRTKQTQEKLLTWGNNPNYLYSEDVNSLLSDLNLMQNYIYKHKEFENIKKYFYDDVDCDNFYDGFYNDSFYQSLNKLYIARNKTADFMYRNLKGICKFFPSSKQKDAIFIFQELNGFNRRLINKLLDNEPRTYQKLKSILDSDLIYDLYLMTLIILRPIRVFTQNNLMNEMVDNAFNSYISFIILNLVLNFVVELLFFYLIKKLVINRTSNIDAEMKNVIKTFMI